jgi:hypothetical protein
MQQQDECCIMNGAFPLAAIAEPALFEIPDLISVISVYQW